MNKFFKAAFIIAVATFMLASCTSNRLKDVDVSGVAIEPVRLKPLYQEIFSTPPDSFRTVTKKMTQEYGNFYAGFIYNIINHGGERDSVFKALKLFVSDKDMNQVYGMVKKEYPAEEIKKIENDLTLAFRYFRFHFPAQEMPGQYVSFVSGFNYNITTIDSTLGIGLDMYLGPDNIYYKMLQWPRYKVRAMGKEYLATDAMRGWIIHCFDKNESQNNLLSHMIFYGKIYYALDAVLPDVEDSIKIGYTTTQMDYCVQYKKNLWAHFQEKERLFKNDLKELAPYIAEGPFTSAISKQCPPRIAMYMGWQIVRAYMNKYPDVTLQQLMDEKDFQKILSKSKYKP